MTSARIPSTYGVIDLGSHTIRLLIAELRENDRIRPIRVERRITRLARGFQPDAILREDSIAESLAALRDYATLLETHRVQAAACGATGVIRRARNADAFLQTVREATSISPGILSESSEAFLSTKGLISVLPKPRGLLLCFDLGGSSTEFLLADLSRSEILWSTSVFVGAATTTERFLPQAPASLADLLAARSALRNALEPTFSSIREILAATGRSALYQLVGTAGTVTTLAAMQLEMRTYQPYRINGLALTKTWLSQTIERIAALSLESRRELPGLETGREDIILGGALIVDEILGGLHQTQLTATDGGLLEGLLLDLLEKESGRPHQLVTPWTWETSEQ